MLFMMSAVHSVLFRRPAFAVTASAMVAVLLLTQRGYTADGPLKRHALPPKWDKRTIDTFFSDAKATLEGDRPKFGDGKSIAKTGTPAGGSTDTPPANGDKPSGGGEAPAGEMAWSKLIAPESLQDEIKSYQTLVKDDVKNPSEFKGGGFKRARRNYSVLAVAFGVISEYDGEVRWKNQALTARDLFARAAANCKVATDATFNESKLRADDLVGLVRGDTLPAAANAETKNSWPKVSARPPLMQRLELAQQDRIAKWTSNAGDFNKNLEEIVREAEVITMIAEVIQKEGYEFTDDNTYKGFARDMQKHAIDIASAAKAKNADQARAAAGELYKACNNCHTSFRN